MYYLIEESPTTKYTVIGCYESEEQALEKGLELEDEYGSCFCDYYVAKITKEV
tara:strand:+ start:161 stop:319 length:159 start_codon:yes stop_codon:yes gene_type:complete